MKRIYLFDVEDSFKMIHCHHLEGIGQLWPINEGTSLVYCRKDLSPAKFFHFLLETIPLKVFYEELIEPQFPEEPDTSGIMWDVRLDGKLAKSAFVR